MLSADHGHADRSETLATSANGRVARCRGCGALELRFGNALLRMDATDLSRVHAAVVPSLRRDGSTASGTLKSIEVYMGDSGVGFAFSHDEIVELTELLEAAQSRLAADPIESALVDMIDDDLIPEPIRRRLNGGFSRGRA
jgi:hypothetical protein